MALSDKEKIEILIQLLKQHLSLFATETSVSNYIESILGFLSTSDLINQKAAIANCDMFIKLHADANFESQVMDYLETEMKKLEQDIFLEQGSQFKKGQLAGIKYTLLVARMISCSIRSPREEIDITID